MADVEIAIGDVMDSWKSVPSFLMSLLVMNYVASPIFSDMCEKMPDMKREHPFVCNQQCYYEWFCIAVALSYLIRGRRKIESWILIAFSGIYIYIWRS